MPEAEKVHLPPQIKKRSKNEKKLFDWFFFLFLMFRLKKYLTIHAKILNRLDMKHFRTSTRYIITITGNFSVSLHKSHIFLKSSRISFFCKPTSFLAELGLFACLWLLRFLFTHVTLHRPITILTSDWRTMYVHDSAKLLKIQGAEELFTKLAKVPSVPV